MYKVLELFAGGGGMTLGLKQAGLIPAAVVEINSRCVETLRTNFPNTKVLQIDIHNTTPAELMDQVGCEVDIITGGVPCQSFSNLGKQGGFEDQRGSLFYKFVDIIKFAKPKIFMIENVRNILCPKFVKTTVKILESTGYVINYKKLNAKNYGVAQSRTRAIIVCVRKDVYYRPFVYPRKKKYKFTIRDALENVPPSPLSRTIRHGSNEHIILRQLKPGQSAFDLSDEYKEIYCSYRRAHKKFVNNKKNSNILAKRASYDDVSITVCASQVAFISDYYHPSENRCFTIRELARLQSFPDDYVFKGHKGDQIRQIGNAVPPKLAYEMGIMLRKYLDNNYEEPLDLFGYIS